MIMLLKDFCDRYKRNQTSAQRKEILRYFERQRIDSPEKYRVGSSLAEKWLLLYHRCTEVGCYGKHYGIWSWPPEPHIENILEYFKMDIPTGTFCFGECRACGHLGYFYHHPLPKRK